MAHEKLFTAKQAAELVLKRTHELLEKSEFAKAETGHEKGVHTHNHEGEGRSAAGSFASAAVKGNTSLPKESLHAAAKEQHTKVLGEMQAMPKPNLGKSEENPMPKPHLDHEGMSKLSEENHHTLSAHHEGEAKKQNKNGNFDHGLEHLKLAHVHNKYASLAHQKERAKHRPEEKGLVAHFEHHAKEAMSHHFGKSESTKLEDLVKYEPQNSKKENAKPSEHNAKSAEQPANGPAPKGEIHPKEPAQGASDDVRKQTAPGSNPKEQAEGNNELAGTTPTQVGQDGKNLPGFDEMQGHIKLAKFIGHMESKRKSKSGVVNG